MEPHLVAGTMKMAKHAKFSSTERGSKQQGSPWRSLRKWHWIRSLDRQWQGLPVTTKLSSVREVYSVWWQKDGENCYSRFLSLM